MSIFLLFDLIKRDKINLLLIMIDYFHVMPFYKTFHHLEGEEFH